ncbi:MAG: exopolyphosphatase, partial [bacterium]|nr:exopolyphosphatase [bacterium]
TDPRTGLGRFKDYRVSNYQLMEAMIGFCLGKPVREILAQPDVRERVDRYFQQEKAYEEMIKANAAVDGNVLVINLLGVEKMLSGNRFKEFVLFPGQNISVRIMWGYKRQNVVLTCGYSLVNRTSNTDIGLLMLKYGGGGHRVVGTAQASIKDWERVKDEIIAQMKEDG